MSRGYWSIIAAVIGCLILGGALYSYYKVEEATQYPYPKEDYQPASKARFPVAVPGQPQAKGYEPNCQQPEKRGDSDLCAQWAAVKAVNESNRLVRIGILMSYALGMLGLGVTAAGTILVYRTLHQSDQSLQAARAGLAQGYRSERAYITFRSAEEKPIRWDGMRNVLVSQALNIGRTPARVYASLGFRLDELPDSAEYRSQATFRDDFYVVGADGNMPMETPIDPESNSIQYFVFAIRYLDSFGRKHEAWGCLSYRPRRREIQNVGGSAWNSDEEMPEKERD